MLLFLFFAGYGLGWVMQKALSRIKPTMGTCNIGTKGTSWRWWLAMGLIALGFYFEIPLAVFFGWFTWYESRAKWCIAQSIIK
jgi:hypothetical protein